MNKHASLRRQFEGICERSNLRLAGMDRIPEGHVYYADGYFTRHPDYPKPHYKTLWAWGKDEKMEIAQPLYFEGTIGSGSLEGRVGSARAAALDYIRSLPDG